MEHRAASTIRLRLLLLITIYLAFTNHVESFANPSSSSPSSSSSPPSSPTTNDLRVTPVKPSTTEDVTDLADLRYAEWMLPSPSPPSPSAFRAATAEILSERAAGGSVALLTRSNGVAVGAAEVGPVEFEGAVTTTGRTGRSRRRLLLYVTDVVTSRDHRRKGVGEATMRAVEEYGIDAGAEGLFLHVEEDNRAARGFYERDSLGYAVPTEGVLEGIDVGRLEENAGTEGQILLVKELPVKRGGEGSGGGGGGFGFGKGGSRDRRSKKRSKR